MQAQIIPFLSEASVAQSNTSITPETAAKQFAEYLTAESWCIDFSSPGKLSAFHAKSNYTHNIEIIRHKFPEWARANKVRIPESEYHEFLATLVDRVAMHMPDIVGSAFRPVAERVIDFRGAKLANTYVPFKPEQPTASTPPAILQEYLDRVLPNKDEQRRVIQYLADIVQNPERRPQWGIIMAGDQGTGKSSIFRLVKAALGGSHVVDLNDYEPATARFSEIYPDNLLVVFDDAVANSKTYQKLKAEMTRKTKSVELKSVQRRVQREVFARTLVCSNSPRALILEPGDRRFLVTEWCQHPVSPQESAEFFVGFNEFMDHTDTPATLYHWLMSVDLSDFVPGSTIQTETHAKMIDLSASALDSVLSEFVESGPIFHDNTLLEHLSQNNFRNPNPNQIKMALATLKYEKKRRKVDGCGDKQIQLWQPSAERGRALLPVEVDSIQRAVSPDFSSP